MSRAFNANFLSCSCLRPWASAVRVASAFLEYSLNQSDTAAKTKGWQCYVALFLKQKSQQLSHSFDIASVIDREKELGYLQVPS